MQLNANLVSDDGCFVSRRAFTDERIYRAEQKQIFGGQWLYLAHESQVREKNDFVTAYMGEAPVIVARGENGAVHVSVNSCSHRGLLVCRADRGRASRLTCPYHAWTYASDGSLIGIPQQKLIERPTDKSALGLKQVPRVETYRGLIFGSFDPDIEPLDRYLGNMRFYLDNYFDRYPGGVEVVGVPFKWRISCNWKIAVENHLGDNGHAAHLHGALLRGTEAIARTERYGINVVPEPGHAASIQLLPDDPEFPPWRYAFSAFSAEAQAFFAETEAQVVARLGPIRARMTGLTFGVYPNFSFIPGARSLRVSHPRGPGQIELWSWWSVPAEAPDSVKQELRNLYTGTFGPGGIVEMEDSDAWAQQYVGSASPYMEDRPYYYGLGLGEEKVHPDLPGVAGTCFNEHQARQFYLRWHRDLNGAGATR